MKLVNPKKVDDCLSTNLAWWDSVLQSHYRSEMYDVEGFVNDPSRITLGSEEIDFLRPIEDIKILHLQCAFGLDTISWSRLGANVCGVDWSKGAVDIAKELAKKVGANANFYCSDLTRQKHNLPENFDAIYLSYGALDWIPDLESYFLTVSRFLKPGGKIVIAEIHPIAVEVTRNIAAPTSANRSNKSQFPTRSTGRSYASGVELHETWNWIWPVSEVLEHLESAGFRLVHFLERESSSYRFHKGLILDVDGRWRWPKVPSGIPLIYALMAMKN